MNRQPYDFGQAIQATNDLRSAQKAAEDNLKAAWRDFGAKRRAYQLALAKAIVRLKAEHGATAAIELARGDEEVARLRFEKDVAEGVKEAAQSALWRYSGDRHDLREFIQWSKGVDLRVHAGNGSETEAEPAEVQTFGRRAA